MKRRFFLFVCLTILGALAFDFHPAVHGSLEQLKTDMTQLEKQLEENAKLGIRAVEFPEGLDWFNVAGPVRITDLKGKVTLLDFWTFCCINCMHVIGELKRLEEKYPEELVVVGVHSAKFANERDSENIRQSILRYEIRHPVVNDPTLHLWQAYGVHAWPTLVLIDPAGHVVLSVSGEGHDDLLDRAIGSLIRRAEAGGFLDRKPLEIKPEEATSPAGILKFPGKIFADQNGLIVSDSNHNQVLILDFEGKVISIVGSGEIGSADGDFDTAQLNHPQGVFREGDLIYAADTENHLIRLIDLKKRAVETIAGTGGRGGHLKEGGHGLEPRQTAFNSPWDLVKVEDTLFIAMAGAHQIWTLDLRRGELDLFVGSGREDIIDGEGASSALAQPSGITFDGDRTFYFADSEASAVRSADLKSRKVKTLIGRGLFEFGDQDGSWNQALLQHPLAVHYSNGIVYVLDTYNDKMKAMDLKSKQIRTIGGTGKPGIFYEPGGLSAFGGKIYVADTNNHRVRVLDLASGEISTLEIKGLPDISAPRSGNLSIRPSQEKANLFLQVVEYPPARVAPFAHGSVGILLPKDHEFTEGLALQFKIGLKDSNSDDVGARRAVPLHLKEGELANPSKELPIIFDLPGEAGGESVLEAQLDIPYCTTVSPKVCKFKSLKLIQPISFGANGKSKLDLHPQID